jgi:hypothetical protein
MTDEVLHVLARAMLRACSPQRAHAFLMRIGALLPQHRTMAEVRRAAASLKRRGTCLSQSLTLAARAPGSQIVIGVAPRIDSRLAAHAWLEMAGEPIDPSDVAGKEIARFGGAGSQRI